jgi:hypothetical protein
MDFLLLATMDFKLRASLPILRAAKNGFSEASEAGQLQKTQTNSL